MAKPRLWALALVLSMTVGSVATGQQTLSQDERKELQGYRHKAHVDAEAWEAARLAYLAAQTAVHEAQTALDASLPANRGGALAAL